jgi:hypothetical protein
MPRGTRRHHHPPFNSPPRIQTRSVSLLFRTSYCETTVTMTEPLRRNLLGSHQICGGCGRGFHCALEPRNEQWNTELNL